MTRLWTTPAPQVSVMPVDWPEWKQVFRAAAGAPLLTDFQDEESGSPEASATGLAGALALAEGPAERQRLVETYLQREVARVLGLAVSKLDVNQPLSTLGIDSLMAVELKNRIESELQVSVPLIRVIQGPSVAELAALLLSLLAGVDPALDAPPKPPAEGQGKGDSLLLSLLSLREDERVD
jgi:acyl carrier protein